MALFNWFSGKSKQTKPTAPSETSKRVQNNKFGAPPTARAPATQDSANRSEQSKVRRHAKREQLYIAVREAMTRAGVLSASYKFKVLSLDQGGDQFLVMVDVLPGLGAQVDKLSESEAFIVQTAKTLFSIKVTSVYWRWDVKPGVMSDRPPGMASRPAELHPKVESHAAKKISAARHEPIQEDEVRAFKQALAGGIATSPALPDVRDLYPDTAITGFEDTEMPESSAAPALSATQYGELR